jgi:plastocyanin
MNYRKAWIVLLCAVFLGLVSGCGGSGEATEDAMTTTDVMEDVTLAEELAPGAHIYTEAAGFGFTPELVTVAVDEDVHFHLEAGHTVVEVDFETWQKSGTEPLEGGFYFGLGESEGTVRFEESGTHYFICLPHAEMDERGQVVVE